jgi:Fe-Mn family superoxide dismutase
MNLFYLFNKKNFIFIIFMVPLFHILADKPKAESPSNQIEYKPKVYKHLLGMEGFSDDLLNIHFTLYQGYVANTNLIQNEINSLRGESKVNFLLYSSLKRRLAWEFNGMRLHEMYFGNLGGAGDPSVAKDLIPVLAKQYGSYELWKKDFIQTGLMRGIGWAILCRDNDTGKLFNIWINEHDVGQLTSSTPLLIMDVFEHAYITQYRLDRAKYIDAFFANIDWAIVGKRASGK